MFVQAPIISKMVLSPILILTILQLVIHHATLSSAVDPTIGFTRLSLDNSNFEFQKPYDVPLNQRYSFADGIHKFWVYSTDKPFMQGSDTLPRTEIRIKGYDYTSGVWQFEGYGYIPSGTTGTCVMQVFGGNPTSTTIQIRVYDGSLTSYRSPVIEANIYNRWFRLNVIHDVGANSVKVYIDGNLKFNGAGRGDANHYFKIGVYTQNDPSNYMESRWRDLKVFRK